MRFHIMLSLGLVLAGSEVALGYGEPLDATVNAEVKEYVGLNVVNVDYAFKDLGQTTDNLPLLAEAQLKHSTDPIDISGAAVTANFSEPNLSTLPDPNEFGLVAAGISLTEDVSYAGRGETVEVRRVTFLESEIGEPNGTALEAHSYFFLDGIVVVWSKSGNLGLSEVLADLSVSVDQIRGTEGVSAPVLSAGLSLVGHSDGTLAVTTSGGISADNLLELDITSSLADVGVARVVVLPELAIPYTYPASVGEQFDLRARVQGSFVNRSGTGAALLIGVPAAEVPTLLNQIVGQGTGGSFGSAVVTQVAAHPAPVKPLSAADRTTKVVVLPQSRLIPAWCGAMGVELVPAALLFALVPGLVRRFR
ncbi:MAG TPA: hypothetical protein PKY77_12070 [Phycisphaerae bacterium]|nr:hypothetical protein [Phycisphaerae bacterium]HRY69302.1 hypothetical protein [Phycisphaerae bacterium]HSA26620.1 hypothetical protein [Phycisphaerae bacterium]